MSASSTTSFNVSSDSAPGKPAMPATLEHGAIDTPIGSSSSDSEHEVSFGPTKNKGGSRQMSPYIDNSPKPKCLGTPTSSRGSSLGLRGAIRPGGSRSSTMSSGSPWPRTSRPPARTGPTTTNARSLTRAPETPPPTGGGGGVGARIREPSDASDGVDTPPPPATVEETPGDVYNPKTPAPPWRQGSPDMD